MDNKRFEIVEAEGNTRGVYVIIDKKTGVNYLMAKFGTAGGLCPLIDKNGKPVISE